MGIQKGAYFLLYLGILSLSAPNQESLNTVERPQAIPRPRKPLLDDVAHRHGVGQRQRIQKAC